MKRLILITIFVLGFTLQGWGAVYHVTAAGTKTSGASIAANWTDANCYSTANLQLAINALATDGDAIILDDITHSITVDLEDNTVALAANASFTISSRSGNSDNCIISSNSATDPIFYARDGSYSYNWTFENIGFTKSVTHTSTSVAALYRRANNTSTVTFSGCKIFDIVVDWGTSAQSTGGLFNINSADWTLTLTDTVMDNISVTVDSASLTYGMFLRTFASGQNVVLNDCDISNITLTQENSAQALSGAFQILGTLTTTGTNRLMNIIMTAPGDATSNHFAFFYSPTTSVTSTVSGVKVNGFTKTGGAHAGGVFRFSGAWTVTDGEFTDFLIESFDKTVNGLGGYVVSHGTSGAGTLSDSNIWNGTVQHGGALYVTQGGDGVAKRVKVWDVIAAGRDGNEAGAGAAFYNGGVGDLTLEFCKVWGCTADEGVAVYGGASGAASKTLKIYNCDFSGNTATGDESGNGGDDILVSAADTVTYTIELKNTVFNSSVTNSIQRAEGASATLDFDLSYSAVLGGIASIDGTITNGTDTGAGGDFAAENNISIMTGTAYEDAGIEIVGVNERSVLDVNGKHPYGLVDIGAKQTWGIPRGSRMLRIGGGGIGIQ